MSDIEFLITRTSQGDDAIKPCEGCKKRQFTRVDIRSARPKDIPAYKGKPEDWWYAEGVNHRELLGPRGGFQGIARDFPNTLTGWFRTFESIDDLLKFTDEHGQVIVRRSWSNPDIQEIEIYDGYRE